MLPNRVQELDAIAESSGISPLPIGANPAFSVRKAGTERRIEPTAYGFELELEFPQGHDQFRRRLAAFLASSPELSDFFATKYDGSLRTGVEIVSQPFTFSFFRKNRALFRNLLTIAYESGAKVGGNTGLHVHISRLTLSDRTKARLFHFVNDVDNRPLMSHLAGRNAQNYAQYYTSETLLSPEGLARHERRAGKYEAMNFQHAATIELRIFKATTKSSLLFARLESVAAAVHFVSSAKSALDCTAQNFFAFVSARTGTYPNLYEHLRALESDADADLRQTC